MKTEIIIFVRLTDTSRVRLYRTIPYILPAGCEVYYDGAPDGPMDEPAWQLIESRRFFDLKTDTLHVWFEIDMELDGEDIPFDSDHWKLEKVS